MVAQFQAFQTNPVCGREHQQGRRKFHPLTTEAGDIHRQPSTQDGGVDDDANGGECSRHICFGALIIPTDLLPFPRDREQLLEYLARGLPLTRLFPVTGSAALKNLVCKGQLELTGDRWTVMQRECSELHGSSTSLRRHVKQNHLHMPASSPPVKDQIACKFDRLSHCGPCLNDA